MNALPDVFSYDDYRPFLQDWFKVHKRDTGRKGTSEFARLAGCTPGHVRNIVTGRRQLQPAFISGFARALRLSSEGASYFALLVRYVHPMSAADRVQASREIRATQMRLGRAAANSRRVVVRARRPAVSTRALDYTDWFHPVVRALALCDGFQENPTWIAQSLRPAVSPVQVAALLRAGGLSHDFALSTVVDPADERSRAAYRKSLGVARWALHNVPPRERRLRSSTWCIPVSAFEQLQGVVHDYERELEALYAEALAGTVVQRSDSGDDDTAPETTPSGPPNVVYQFMIQVFPLSASSDR